MGYVRNETAIPLLIRYYFEKTYYVAKGGECDRSPLPKNLIIAEKSFSPIPKTQQSISKGTIQSHAKHPAPHVHSYPEPAKLPPE